MGLLTRLRDWFAGLLGGSEPDDSGDPDGSGTDTTGEDGAAGDGDDANDGGGLDPTAVTETRSDATDDAVDALRTVRESAPPNETDDDDGSADPDDPDRSGTGR